MKQTTPWFISILLPGSLLLATAAAAQPPCDPTLTPETNRSIQYRQRGNDLRCEGFYRANVGSSGGLNVVGLLQRPLRFGAEDEVLSIGSPLRDQRVLVRGQGIPVKLYYRLDAVLEPGGSMHWPVRLLQGQGIGPDQVGLYGRLADRKGWYVPLDITGKQSLTEQPRLLLRTSVDIDEVQWRHAAVAEGRCTTMTAWKKLDAAAGFSGGEAIPVNLPPQGNGRQLCLEVAARTRRDGNWLKRLVRIQR
jgi:hypothetical protein